MDDVCSVETGDVVEIKEEIEKMPTKSRWESFDISEDTLSKLPLLFS